VEETRNPLLAAPGLPLDENGQRARCRLARELDRPAQARPAVEPRREPLEDGPWRRALRPRDDADPFTEPKHVSAGERPFVDPAAVQEHAVPAPEVAQDVDGPCMADLRVVPRRLVPRQDDAAIFTAPENERGSPERRDPTGQVREEPPNRGLEVMIGGA
jgi:hypothetical protein